MLSATTSATATVSLTVVNGRCACFELGYGKGDGVEERTRIFITRCRNALLIGHTVIGCLNKDLRGAHNSYYRKYAEGYKQLSSLVGHTHVAACTLAYASGDLTAAIVAGALTVNDLVTKDDRLYRFNDGNGCIVGYERGIAHTAEGAALAGGKRPEVPFSAVKDYVLLKRGDTREALASTNAKAALANHLNVIPYGNAVKAAVKRNGVYADVCGDKLGILDAYAVGGGDYSLTVCIEINSCILKAVSVTAGVEHSFRVYAHGTSCILLGTA